MLTIAIEITLPVVITSHVVKDMTPPTVVTTAVRHLTIAIILAPVAMPTVATARVVPMAAQAVIIQPIEVRKAVVTHQVHAEVLPVVMVNQTAQLTTTNVRLRAVGIITMPVVVIGTVAVVVQEEAVA